MKIKHSKEMEDFIKEFLEQIEIEKRKIIAI